MNKILEKRAFSERLKQRVLAVWLEVSAEWLRFGAEELATQQVTEQQRGYEGVRYNLQDLPNKFAQLSPRQKQAVYDVVEAMLEGKSKK